MKLKYNTVLNRLQNLINEKISHKDIAEILIADKVTKTDDIKKVANALSSRLLNDGYLNDEEIKSLEKYVKCPLSDFSHNDTENIELDYFTDTFASCGTGVLAFSNTKDKIKLTKDNIKGYNENKKYSVINAYGVSMQPYIQDLDKLIVEHWDIPQQIIDNRIYVFLYKDELFVKRLAKNIDDVVITSDNPRFDDKVVKADEDLQIIGQIVGILRDVR